MSNGIVSILYATYGEPQRGLLEVRGTNLNGHRYELDGVKGNRGTTMGKNLFDSAFGAWTKPTYSFVVVDLTSASRMEQADHGDRVLSWIDGAQSRLQGSPSRYANSGLPVALIGDEVIKRSLEEKYEGLRFLRTETLDDRVVVTWDRTN